MKKKVLLIASVFAASTLFAQDLTSRKGETYLPEANDWAISFDAAPFLTYAGGILGGNASSPSASYVGNGLPWHIRGKMFKDEKTAYRAGIRLAFGSDSYTNMVNDDAVTTAPTFPTAPSMVEDGLKMGGNNIVLTGGLEMRRGNTRLQGYYGGELMIGFGGTKNAYTYGNAFSTTNTTPSTTDWSALTGETNMGAIYPGYGAVNARLTESKTSSMMVGLRGFIGAEYFIMPKISIGAEYGWGLGLSSNGTSMSFEGHDGTAAGSVTEETKTSSFGFDTDINNSFGGSGSLNIIFHF